MPCRSDGYDEWLDSTYPWKSDSAIKAYLCGLCRALGGEPYRPNGLRILARKVDWAEVGFSEDDFWRWWEEHQMEDIKRGEADARELRTREAEERAELERLQKKYGGKP